MKVLITGDKGFIGRQVFTFLKGKGIDCVGYDLVDGKDLLNKKQLEASMNGVNQILHLAAVGDVYQVAKDPQKALITGIVGTQNLVEAANMHPSIKKIIYISTWEIYGDPHHQPIDEAHPCNPDAPYSIAKYGGELVVRSQSNKIPWIILRLGTVFGPHMRGNSVFSIFIKKALNNEPITLQNGGKQKRQFTHIDDVSEVIYQAIKSKRQNIILNVVDDFVITIKQLAQMIKKISSSRSPIIIDKPRSNDPPSSIIDGSKARSILHWKPHVRFEAALSGMINNK